MEILHHIFPMRLTKDPCDVFAHISPRKQRLDAETGKRKAIPPGERIEDGRSLAQWGDGGWGQLIRSGRETDGTFDQRLADALAAARRRRVAGRPTAVAGH